MGLSIYLLPRHLDLDPRLQNCIGDDYERFGDSSLPSEVERYILDEYGVDVSARYGPFHLRNPFGKASGQLSTNLSQVAQDGRAGFGFVVLKTVIAQDDSGFSEMSGWQVAAPRMVVERITSKRGEEGWTVTWKGRGWEKSFRACLEFMKDALEMGRQFSMPVIPSCKYHLPAPLEDYNEAEYRYTTQELARVWHSVHPGTPMVMEKDFSPTLAGSDLVQNRDNAVRWLSQVPALIKKWCRPGGVKVGLKLMNALYGDEFQVDMLSLCLAMDGPVAADHLVCFNRLFDPGRVFEGRKGVAYGGYDLSDRNLSVLTSVRQQEGAGRLLVRDVPMCATGNINSGRMMAEYALRGCESGQIHTYCQLPAGEYRMRGGSRSEKALHELFFNPDHGLVAAMAWLRDVWGLGGADGVIRFKDVCSWYKHGISGGAGNERCAVDR